MKNSILFGNKSLTRFTAEIFAKILQNILRIFSIAKSEFFSCIVNKWLIVVIRKSKECCENLSVQKVSVLYISGIQKVKLVFLQTYSFKRRQRC